MGIKTAFINLLNKVIPKKDIIIFESYPNISDNSLALYDYIIQNRSDLQKKYRMIWAKKGTLDIGDLKLAPKTLIIEKKSIKGVMCFLRARYIISTHGYFRGVKSGRGQIQVNLWHGCGYKDMTPEDRGYHGDLTIVTSELYRNIFAEIFCLNQRDVYITGYPRNDVLFTAETVLGKLGIMKEQFSRIILWMPTYRKAAIGHSGIDGKEKSFTASYLSDKQWNELDRVLSKSNYMLIVKPHPMDAVRPEGLERYGNIRCVTTEELQHVGVRLYELLADSDVLLSDYSSVIVDYLLLDRPIAMVLSDMEEYKQGRGFLFEPLEDYLPGPIVNNLGQLISYVEHLDEVNEQWRCRRKKLINIMHQYCDGLSSQRVTEVIFGG